MFLYAFAGAAWSYVVDHLAQILELEVQHRELRGPHVQPRTGDHHEVIRPPPP